MDETEVAQMIAEALDQGPGQDGGLDELDTDGPVLRLMLDDGARFEITVRRQEDADGSQEKEHG